MEFLEGLWEFKYKKPSVGGVRIFSGTTLEHHVLYDKESLDPAGI